MKKKLSLLLSVILFCSISLSACTTSNDSTHSQQTNQGELSTHPQNTISETENHPKETASTALGYTLEELDGASGLFYILEDGTFARYRAGGFKMWSRSGQEKDTLFIPASNVESNPILTQDDTIALFSTANVSRIFITPVSTEFVTVSVNTGDETLILNPFWGSVDIDGIIHYYAITLDDHDDDAYIQLVNSTADYLFGVPMEEVTYLRYNKDLSTATYHWDSFPKNTKLTISYVEGTKVHQITKEADYYWYIYGDYYVRNNPDLTFVSAKIVPTVQGYGAISMKEIPTGQYVMVIELDDNTYYGTVLNVK